ncbi:MAG: DUF167 domain-containing protein [Candidatus Krumholzibacteria bacterium]|nr:DUF167 domain-containing protein [Candidatus Krumholzibacteria bacterium]
MKEIKDSDEGRIRFRVRVQPAAPRDELLGWNVAGELRIKVAAPPHEGEANKELVRFLAKRFAVARREIVVESGEKSRSKIVSAPASIAAELRALPDIG